MIGVFMASRVSPLFGFAIQLFLDLKTRLQICHLVYVHEAGNRDVLSSPKEYEPS
jgi:hypothetical protein